MSGTCTCRERLVDYVARTIDHPFRSCPRFGRTGPLDDLDPVVEYDPVDGERRLTWLVETEPDRWTISDRD